MSFRGGGDGRRGFFQSGGGERGFGGKRDFDLCPPNTVIPLGRYAYSCELDLIIKVDINGVPFFNAPIYLENKECIGKIDEIFGQIQNYYVSVRTNENISPRSFELDDVLYIDPTKILPFSRFTEPNNRRGGTGRGRGGVGSRGRRNFAGRGTGFGGRGGGFTGWRGGGRGGGFSNRGSNGGFNSYQGRGGFGGSQGRVGFKKSFGAYK